MEFNQEKMLCGNEQQIKNTVQRVVMFEKCDAAA